MTEEAAVPEAATDHRTDRHAQLRPIRLPMRVVPDICCRAEPGPCGSARTCRPPNPATGDAPPAIGPARCCWCGADAGGLRAGSRDPRETWPPTPISSDPAIARRWR